MKPLALSFLKFAAFFIVGAALGVIIVDDHPNAQKLTIAEMRGQLQEDQKAMAPMVPACMKFLDTINSTHAMEALPK